MNLEDILKKKNVQDLDIINSQVVSFYYKDLYVHFFLYKDTIYGEAYKKDYIKDYEKLRNFRLLIFSSKEEIKKFQKETNYIHFILEGDIEKNIKNLIRILDMPIDYVFEIQDEKGTLYIKEKNMKEIKKKVIKTKLKNKLFFYIRNFLKR